MKQPFNLRGLWYDLMRSLLRLAFVPMFNVRCSGYERMPDRGGGLVVCNHQSHLDPMLLGMASRRRLNFLARQSLFKFAPLGWLMGSLDAVPLDRDGSGIAGMKETLRRLKREQMVLIFPEGTRSPDGEIGHLKPGFCGLARRSNVTLVPVAIAGAFEAWPRTRSFPQPGRIHVRFGKPIGPELVATLTDEGLLAEVERRMRECHAEARQFRQRS